jgi:LacI family transcriptional regulator/LacI family repressor for deo operon, udp, cdd, tsx, nupC, and nupG
MKNSLKQPERRPTQKDIAREAGVSRPTVSLALKGSSVVSLETREHVRQVAEKLGYTPDPMLSALSKYRNQNIEKSYQGTLAWISHYPKNNPWNRITPYREYHIGAQKRAEQLGYNIEQIDMQQQELSANRLDGILSARGIKGLLICPPGRSDEQFDIPWNHYSLITFGYTITTPNMHRVSSSHYRATRAIFRRLNAAGYKRIGFVFNSQINVKTQEHCQSAYLTGCRNTNQEMIPELLQESITTQHFTEWYETYKPDAVIISSPQWSIIQQSKIKIPEELAVACPMVPKDNPELTGIMEKCQEIGAAAVDTLVHMIEHEKRGIPANPKYILLEGEWNEGSTLKQSKSGT